MYESDERMWEKRMKMRRWRRLMKMRRIRKVTVSIGV